MGARRHSAAVSGAKRRSTTASMARRTIASANRDSARRLDRHGHQPEGQRQDAIGSRPSRTRRCSTCCATISSSTAPSSAAGWRNAAPARCWSTARRCAPASRRSGSVGDAEITTLEGLGTLEKPHPLQQAFIDEQAAQCGYCINGMIMTAKALLDRNPHSDRSRRARRRSAGNLCRCGTHNRIVRAVLRAATDDAGGPDMNAPTLTVAAASPPGSAASCSPSRSLRSCARAAARAQLPGSLDTNRMLDAWMRINADGTRDRLHRQGRTGAGHPDRAGADRGRRARSAARRASR